MDHFFKIYLLFMGVLGLRFCARAFSSCGKWGPLLIAVRGPLIIAASLVAEHRLQMRRLSNCGSRAQLLCGIWDPPRPGLELVSPALAGRLSTAAPPGKPRKHFVSVYLKKSVDEQGARCQFPMGGMFSWRYCKGKSVRFISCSLTFCGAAIVLFRFRKLIQWYCNIPIRQLVFSPSIINQIQDPSISLYLTVHSPAALILPDLQAKKVISST